MRRFETILPKLAKHGVEVVALSKDTPQDATEHRERDKLSLQLLSDPKLEVLKDYGAEHHKAVEFSKVVVNIFGVPLGLMPSFQSMAVPTTILVDEHGIIQWIDQAEDYRLRSAEDRVLAEVQRVFGETSSTPA
ncbi:MAG: peroxiredoxin family protein [Nannocystaceae bacterium]|nr:peroxiredoxin family protein [Nannocystaceae bacterium]